MLLLEKIILFEGTIYFLGVQTKVADSGYIRFIFGCKCIAMDSILDYSKYCTKVLWDIKYSSRLDLDDLYDCIYTSNLSC